MVTSQMPVAWLDARPQPTGGFGVAEDFGVDYRVPGPSAATPFFIGPMIDSDEAWCCYGAVDDDEPLAYAAMHLDSGVATLAFASRRSERREGAGQVALLNRCIQRTAAEGCDMITVTDAGHGPAVIDRECLVRVAAISDTAASQ